MPNIDLRGLNDLDFLFEPKNKKKKDNLLLNVSIDQLMRSSFQPRKPIKPEDVTELADSIKSQGILQPIIVRTSGNFYEIIAGERRWQAAQLAGLQEVPVIIKDIDDATVIAIALIENIHRQDLSVIDEAKSIKRLVDEFSLTHESVGKLLGKSRSSISNMIRILNLPENIIKMIEDGMLELGHAKILVGLDSNILSQAINIINARKLSVRDLEDIVCNLTCTTNNIEPINREIDVRVQMWQERLMQKLHSKVKVNLTKDGKGRVLIHFETTDEIEWLINKLEEIS